MDRARTQRFSSMLRACVLFGAISAALSDPVARFAAAVTARDLDTANALCERGVVPTGADLRVPGPGAKGTVPLVDALRALVDDTPDAISLLACVIQKRIAPPPADGGAELLWLAATKQHVRLAAALLTEATPFARPHVDAASRGGVFHAALLNRIFVLDVVHRTLLAHEESRREGAGGGAAANATIAWLEARGVAVARHVSPPAAAEAVRSAVAALVRIASGDDSAEPLRAVRTSDAQGLANALSLLLVRVLLDGLAKHAAGSLREAESAALRGHAAIRASDGAVVPALPHEPSTAAAAASHARTAWAQWLVLRQLEVRDRFGRSPLHAAAATGNAAALRVLAEALHEAAARALQALAGVAAVLPPPAPSGSLALRWCVDAARGSPTAAGPDEAAAGSLSYEAACRGLLRGVNASSLGEPGAAASAALARLARFIRAEDARGVSAVDAACLAGFDDAAALLAGTLARAGVTAQTEDDKSVEPTSPREPWQLQHVVSWAAAYAEHGWQRSPLCARVIDSPPRPFVATNATLPSTSSSLQADAMGLTAPIEDSTGGWRAPAHTPLASSAAVDAVLEHEEGARLPQSLAADRAASAAAGAAPPPGGSLRCDFDVADGAALSAEAFQAHYQVRGLPVLLRGLAERWPLRRAWTREGLASGPASAAAFGSVGRLPYAAAFGAPAAELLGEVSLGAFVGALLDGEGAGARYVFDSPASPASQRAAAALDALAGGGAGPRSASAAGAAALLAPLELVPPFLQGGVLLPAGGSGGPSPPPPLVRPSPAPKPQVFVGGPGSGAPLHYHTDAWNALAYGRKHWWLLPPAAAAYSAAPPAEWAAGALGAFARLGGPLARPFECVQEAGDVVYVPAGWAHAVLNTGRNVTVGAAVELALDFPGPGGWVQP